MQQRAVGATGLTVSRLGLGTMTWGRDTDEHEARDQLIEPGRLDFPNLVGKLVLVNTFAKLRPAKPGDWLYFANRFVLVHTLGLETQARFVSQRIFPNADQAFFREELVNQILSADPGSYRAAMRSLGLFDVKNRLGEIHTPVLVVTGERDTTVPLPIQRQLAAGIPGARQVIIPGAGHAVTVDHPEAFNSVMLDFLLK